MGFIYQITNTIKNKKYVGETTRTIPVRFQEHKDSAAHYKRFLENPTEYTWKGSCTYLYKAMNKYGVDYFIIEMIVEVPDEQIDENEIKYIKELNTLAPNGYNLTTGGGKFNHCEKTKQLLREKIRAIMLKDIDKFRRSEFTKGMPPFVAYKDTGKYKSYYVNNHPLCKRKYFSESTYGSIEAAKQACIEFVNNLNATGKAHEVKGPKGVPVKGLRLQKNGYQVRKTVKGKVIEKSFTDKSKTSEENLQLALAFIESLKQ